MSSDDVNDVDFENDANVFMFDVLTFLTFDALPFDALTLLTTQAFLAGVDCCFDGGEGRQRERSWLTSAFTRNQLAGLRPSSSLQLRSLGLLKKVE